MRYFANLRQLVVVGNTSCGKSSLLQAITRLPFPVSPDLCTRFATETVIQRCRPNSRPGYKIAVRDPASGTALYVDDFPKTYTNGSWSDVYRHLKEDLIEAFAVMKMKQKVHQRSAAASGRKNSKPARLQEDIMTVEVSKPDQAHFSIVDIPGLVNSKSLSRSCGYG